MAALVLDANLERALELVGGKIDPEIESSYDCLEERILAQALENVEVAERRLREIERLVGELVAERRPARTESGAALSFFFSSGVRWGFAPLNSPASLFVPIMLAFPWGSALLADDGSCLLKERCIHGWYRCAGWRR